MSVLYIGAWEKKLFVHTIIPAVRKFAADITITLTPVNWSLILPMSTREILAGLEPDGLAVYWFPETVPYVSSLCAGARKFATRRKSTGEVNPIVPLTRTSTKEFDLYQIPAVTASEGFLGQSQAGHGTSQGNDYSSRARAGRGRKEILGFDLKKSEAVGPICQFQT